MYAVVKTGGKQYRVSEGDRITVEKINSKPGNQVPLDILFIVDGTNIITDESALADASVNARVIEHTLGDKVRIFKFKKRKGYKRLRGHRQDLTILEIDVVSKEKVEPEDAPEIELDEFDELDEAETEENELDSEIDEADEVDEDEDADDADADDADDDTDDAAADEADDDTEDEDIEDEA